MRILIFSDSHLTARFNNKKHHFLRSIIEPADKVYILGDFWDSYYTSFDKFINSKWSQLFPLLKARQTVYLYGNHDPHDASDMRTALFSYKSAAQIEFELDGKKFYLEHGDMLSNKININPGNKLLRTLIRRFSILLIWTEKIVTKIFGIKFFRLLRAIERQNELIINKVNEIHEKHPDKVQTVRIHGHTHIPLYLKEKNLIILGGVRHGHANYMTIENGEIQIHNATY